MAESDRRTLIEGWLCADEPQRAASVALGRDLAHLGDARACLVARLALEGEFALAAQCANESEGETETAEAVVGDGASTPTMRAASELLEERP